MPGRREKEQLISISSLLQKVIYKKKWQKRIDLYSVFSFWEQVVGEDIAVNSRPVVINGNVLWVEVRDSAWMQQLSYMKYSFLEKINGRLHPQYLEDIRFRLGIDGFTSIRITEPVVKQTPDVREKQEFEKLLTVVPDKDAREALGRLWTTFASYKK